MKPTTFIVLIVVLTLTFSIQLVSASFEWSNLSYAAGGNGYTLAGMGRAFTFNENATDLCLQACYKDAGSGSTQAFFMYENGTIIATGNFSGFPDYRADFGACYPVTPLAKYRCEPDVTALQNVEVLLHADVEGNYLNWSAGSVAGADHPNDWNVIGVELKPTVLAIVAARETPKFLRMTDDVVETCEGTAAGDVGYNWEEWTDGVMTASGTAAFNYSSGSEVNVHNLSSASLTYGSRHVFSCQATNGTNVTAWVNSSEVIAGFGVVTTCDSLNVSNMTYLLQNDIEHHEYGCIAYEADNVTFDCQGHKFTQDDGGGLAGGTTMSIWVANGNQSITTLAQRTKANHVPYLNPTLQNCVFDVNDTAYEAVTISAETFDLGTIRVTNNTFYDYTRDVGLFMTETASGGVFIENNTFRDGKVSIMLGVYAPNTALIRGNHFARTQMNFASGLMPINSTSIYDNVFNDTVFLKYANNSQYWNVSPFFATNIVGGNYTAGNFWADNASTGFSDTCAVNASTNLCDSSHTIVFCNDADANSACDGTYYNSTFIDFAPLGVPTLPACVPNWVCSGFGPNCTNSTLFCANVTDTNSCAVPFAGNLSTYDIACSSPPPVLSSVSALLQLLAIEIVLLILVGLVDSTWKHKSSEVEKYFHYIYIALVVIAIAAFVMLGIFHP